MSASFVVRSPKSFPRTPPPGSLPRQVSSRGIHQRTKSDLSDMSERVRFAAPARNGDTRISEPCAGLARGRAPRLLLCLRHCCRCLPPCATVNHGNGNMSSSLAGHQSDGRLAVGREPRQTSKTYRTVLGLCVSCFGFRMSQQHPAAVFCFRLPRCPNLGQVAAAYQPRHALSDVSAICHIRPPALKIRHQNQDALDDADCRHV